MPEERLEVRAARIAQMVEHRGRLGEQLAIGGHLAVEDPERVLDESALTVFAEPLPAPDGRRASRPRRLFLEPAPEALLERGPARRIADGVDDEGDLER